MLKIEKTVLQSGWNGFKKENHCLPTDLRPSRLSFSQRIRVSSEWRETSLGIKHRKPKTVAPFKKEFKFGRRKREHGKLRYKRLIEVFKKFSQSKQRVKIDPAILVSKDVEISTKSSSISFLFNKLPKCRLLPRFECVNVSVLWCVCVCVCVSVCVCTVQCSAYRPATDAVNLKQDKTLSIFDQTALQQPFFTSKTGASFLVGL